MPLDPPSRSPIPPPPPPVSDSSIPAPGGGSTFAGKKTETTEGQPHVPPGQPIPGKPLLERTPSVPEGQLPSLKQDSVEGLQARKTGALEKLGKAMEHEAHADLIGRALGVLNKEDGAEAKEKDQIVITVAPPPDFKAVSVFPPEPGIDPEKLKELQEIAMKSLNGYQEAHKGVELNKDALKTQIEGLKTELTNIQQELKAQNKDEPDWMEQFNKLKARDYSFEIEDKEGNLVLTAKPKSADKPKPKETRQEATPQQPQPGQGVPQPGTAIPNTVGNLKPLLNAPRLQALNGNDGVQRPATVFIGPGNNDQGFSDIFDRSGNPNGPVIGSLNAGDSQLYLGGGTINSAFGNILTGSSDPQGNPYADYHTKLQALPVDDRGFCEVDLQDGQAVPGVKFSLCCPAHDGIGSAFVHVFDDQNCPYRNQRNRAMVYIVPPNGADYNTKDEFLAAVRKTAANTLALVHEYNMRAKARGLEPLETLRTCRFSSGNYAKAGVNEYDVARAIDEGYNQACRQMVANDGAVLINTIEYEDGNRQLFSGARIRQRAARPNP
ncbi:hypothetical protein [Parendozoicomonas haliclonae]|uniref:Uncharacterized protein n=1 Tax=Parendozoicomonas haliclonae TaxID=1960125 RepID=A0A1X7AH27_9GAMM|nr:hypothetical protein [Parendozoicomonas haliclonae]SMA41749.1 hypothetical protein EHSB41UT_01319 [Parendozoicomonas haliclonae]